MLEGDDNKVTATIEVLTAEVRTLLIGHRQVTLSVYRQLDNVHPCEIEPFGRVSDGKEERGAVYVVGRNRRDGALVKSARWFYDWRIELWPDEDEGPQITIGPAPHGHWVQPGGPFHREAVVEEGIDWLNLPLIVLAGLR